MALAEADKRKLLRLITEFSEAKQIYLVSETASIAAGKSGKRLVDKEQDMNTARNRMLKFIDSL